MATTTYGVNDALAVKLWKKTLDVEVLKETFIQRFIGNSASSLIQMKTETSKGPGDKVTYGLRMQLSGTGVTEGQVLEGNEESLTTYSDSILINELAHAVKVTGKNTIDQQRVTFDMREEAKDGLRDWYAGRIDQTFFSHIAGDTTAAVNTAVYNGNNTIVAPTASTRIITINSHAEGSLVAGDELTIGAIDKAVAMAKTATPMIRPLRIMGGDYYCLFVHPYQVLSLRSSLSTSALTWADIQKARIQGGEKDVNKLFEGGSYLGMYNGCLIYESTRIPPAISSGAYVSNTRRAVLCGAQAASIAFGQNFDGAGDTKFNWVEEDFDYKRRLGVSAQTVWGFKKTVYNSTDFGTIVIPTYAAAP